MVLQPAQSYNLCILLLPSVMYRNYIKEENPSKALLIDMRGQKKSFLKRPMHFNLLSSKIDTKAKKGNLIMSMNNLIHFQNHPKYHTRLI